MTTQIVEAMNAAGISKPIIEVLKDRGVDDNDIEGFKTYGENEFYGIFNKYLSRETSDKFLKEIKKKGGGGKRKRRKSKRKQSRKSKKKKSRKRSKTRRRRR